MVTIFLSGMCYAGKTTIGRLLAQRLNKYNIDSRDIFKIKYGISETEYLQQYGKDKFKEAEEKSLHQDFNKSVVSLGGSAIYYENTMKMLNDNHIIIWLNVPFNVIENRKNAEGLERPVVYPDGIETFEELYLERYEKYKKYYKLQIDVVESDTPNDVVNKIIKNLFN